MGFVRHGRRIRRNHSSHDFFDSRDVSNLEEGLQFNGSNSCGQRLTDAFPITCKEGIFQKEGCKDLQTRFKETIELNGGKVLVDHKVDKIIVEGGEVKGVRVGDKKLSEVLSCPTQMRRPLFGTVGKRDLNGKIIGYVKNLKMSPSCFAVFLGVDLNLFGYPTLIKNLDEGYDIVINSNADPSLAPKGKASITSYHCRLSNFPEKGNKRSILKRK